MDALNSDATTFSLVSEATDTESPKSRLLVHGTDIDVEIDGAILEACIACDEGYLVFSSNDCPYEESLNIYLINNENVILDHATLFWAYNTGTFKLVKMIEPNRVAFEFFNEKNWSIEIHPEKRFKIPFLSDPRGVWRKRHLYRHFSVVETVLERASV